jgi:hypothetical protein
VTKTNEPTKNPPVTSSSRDAVESAIERSKGRPSVDWDDEQQDRDRIPTWDDVTKLKKTAATCHKQCYL